MPLIRLTVSLPASTDEDLAGALAALLMARGLPGFELRQDPALSLITWIDPAVQPEADLRFALGALGLEATWRLEDEGDGWRDQLIEDHPPLTVGPLTIRALTSGEARCPPRDLEGRLQIALAPGMAFGAGRHPTTALTLAALVERCADAPPARVVDVGCGAGILALAALRLGAEAAWGIDIEPGALRASAEHAAVNGLADQLTVAASLPSGAQGDLVLANITPPVLRDLAPLIVDACAPGGQIMLCGLRAHHVEAISAHYLDLGIHRGPARADDQGWRLLTFHKAA